MSYAVLPQRVVAPSPEELAGYLRSQGWSHQASANGWSVFEKGAGVLEVPLKSGASDYARHALSLLEDLARIEARASSEILRDIRGTTLDIVRLRISGARVDSGRLPVEIAANADQAARDLLLAAACSAWEPRAVYAGRRPKEVTDLLAESYFGRPEIGSYVMSLECAVPPRFEFALPGTEDDVEQPFARKATRRLIESLAATEHAVRAAGQDNSLDPFRAPASGISANLCDAVADLLEATDADSITASVSFATQRPLVGIAPSNVVLPRDIRGTLRAAAKQLREEAEYVAFELVGPVVRLSSNDALQGGRAIVYAALDGKLRNVALELNPCDYAVAQDVHSRAGQLAAVGKLVRERRQWVLQAPSDVRVAPHVDG